MYLKPPTLQLFAKDYNFFYGLSNRMFILHVFIFHLHAVDVLEN